MLSRMVADPMLEVRIMTLLGWGGKGGKGGRGALR
jgi:hypothetical protein